MALTSGQQLTERTSLMSQSSANQAPIERQSSANQTIDNQSLIWMSSAPNEWLHRHPLATFDWSQSNWTRALMASNGHHLNHLNQFPPPPSIPAILEGSRGIQPDGAGLDGSQGPAPPPPPPPLGRKCRPGCCNLDANWWGYVSSVAVPSAGIESGRPPVNYSVPIAPEK